MSSFGLFGGAIPLLEKAIDLHSARHNVIAANIANFDTPNYKSFDIALEEEIARFARPTDTLIIQRTHPAHLGPDGPGDTRSAGYVYDEAPPFNLREDGNTVNLDREMSRMAQNNLMYNTATQIISSRFKGLKDIISSK